VLFVDLAFAEIMDAHPQSSFDRWISAGVPAVMRTEAALDGELRPLGGDPYAAWHPVADGADPIAMTQAGGWKDRKMSAI